MGDSVGAGRRSRPTRCTCIIVHSSSSRGEPTKYIFTRTVLCKDEKGGRRPQSSVWSYYYGSERGRFRSRWQILRKGSTTTRHTLVITIYYKELLLWMTECLLGEITRRRIFLFRDMFYAPAKRDDKTCLGSLSLLCCFVRPLMGVVVVVLLHKQTFSCNIFIFIGGEIIIVARYARNTVRSGGIVIIKPSVGAKKESSPLGT